MNKVLSDLDKNGYYNTTTHTCILKLHLPLEIINDIYKNLYNKNEVSGVFYVDETDKVSHVDKNEGDTGSVYTPNNVINYHTHPINAYREGKTAFGSPSGEDYRETLKFALAGNKAHLVFTVEGIYTIQVSPCKIKKMRELLTDTERGVLIFAIEEYFKTTHDFRCCEELNELSQNDININAYSFVDFANTFDIPNLLAPGKITYKKCKEIQIHKTGHSSINTPRNNKLYTQIDRNTTFGKIPNMGFPEIVYNQIVTKPLKSFISRNDFDDLRKITLDGKEIEFDDKMDTGKVLEILKQISKKMKSTPCNIEWNSNPNSWFFVNFFPTQHYINDSHKHNKKCVCPSLETQELYLTHEPFIRIFSNSRAGCKITKIAKTHNFNMGKRFQYFGKTKKNNTFTFGKGKGNLKSDIKYLKKL